VVEITQDVEILIDGDTAATAKSLHLLGAAGGDALTLTMTGGALEIPWSLDTGPGHPYAYGSIRVGQSNEAIFNMSGGLVTVAGPAVGADYTARFMIGTHGGTGTVNLSGGTIQLGGNNVDPDVVYGGSPADGNLYIGDRDSTGAVYGTASTGTLNFSGTGELLIYGDHTTQIGLWKTGGQITGDPIVTYHTSGDLSGWTQVYIPEPATVAILGLGSLVLLRRRR
jgi:hypothetical protein